MWIRWMVLVIGLVFLTFFVLALGFFLLPPQGLDACRFVETETRFGWPPQFESGAESWDIADIHYDWMNKRTTCSFEKPNGRFVMARSNAISPSLLLVPLLPALLFIGLFDFLHGRQRKPGQ